MTVVRFTEQEMENWREADRKTPRTRKLFDLAKAYAEQEGGQTPMPFSLLSLAVQVGVSGAGPGFLVHDRWS